MNEGYIRNWISTLKKLHTFKNIFQKEKKNGGSLGLVFPVRWIQSDDDTCLKVDTYYNLNGSSV